MRADSVDGMNGIVSTNHRPERSRAFLKRSTLQTSNCIPLAARRCADGVGFRLFVLVGCVLTGCATDSFRTHGFVESELGSRTGIATIEGRRGREVILPTEIESGQALSSDVAIQTALANNDGFHATLAQMGMAEGDFIQAGLLTNPSFSTMIPAGVKQWEWTLFVPIEAFLLRPERMALAEKDCERIAQQLVQNGLTLVRDVRVAHANLALATEQHRLGLEALAIRQNISDLIEKRLQAGDIAELESMQARVDLLNSKADATLLEQSVGIAREQLALLMGIPEHADNLQADSFTNCNETAESLDQLVEQATSNRPDLQAADWAVCAAESRCRLSHKAWWRFDGVADANGSGNKGYEMGPGLRFDVPIFNKNEGGIARSEAELTAANYNRDQIRDSIVQQIRLASKQFRQASDNFNSLNSEVLPALAEAVKIAEKGFADGGTSYLLVLQTTSQYVDAKRRMLDQAAAKCRAAADLELSCGRRLNSTPLKTALKENPKISIPVVRHENNDPVRRIGIGLNRMF